MNAFVLFAWVARLLLGYRACGRQTVRCMQGKDMLRHLLVEAAHVFERDLLSDSD